MSAASAAEVFDTAPSPIPSASDAPLTQATGAEGLDQPVAGAEGIKQAVASKSETFGDIVNTLDNLALQIGQTRISVWDMIVVCMVIALVIAIGYFGGKLANRLIEKMTRFDQTQRLLAEKIVSMLVWAVAILIGVDILGIDLTAFTVFSGAFGLAIGFGLQKTFGNLIAGIILLLDKSIKPGDVIAVSDQAGNSTFGQIQKIGIRAVSLTTRDRKEYLIPNENLMINQVENWSYSSKNVRMQVEVGVSYLADMAKAEELMLQAARSVERVLAVPPPTVWWDAYGDSSVNFTINCWISDPEEGVSNVRSAVLRQLWWLFKENEIEIPFPQRDINLRDGEAFRDLIAAMREGAPPPGTSEKERKQEKPQ